MPEMYDVTAEEVLAFIGQGLPEAMVNAHIISVAAMVREYTRDQGFAGGHADPALQQVIISATARSVANPTHLVNQRAGTQSWTPGQFSGFTLPELKTLNRYRKLAG